MAVIVPGVLGQDAAEMPLAEDQYVVQELGSVVDEELFGLSARGPGVGPVIVECGGVRRPVRGGRRPFRRR